MEAGEEEFLYEIYKVKQSTIKLVNRIWKDSRRALHTTINIINIKIYIY